MNRLYAVETMPAATGSRADHRLPLAPQEIVRVAQRIAAGVNAPGVSAATGLVASDERTERWVAAVVKDLQAHRGSSLVIAGESQPPVVHALAHAMNQVLGNVGRTVIYTDPVEAAPIDQLQSLRDLTTDMNGGKVDLLVIVGGNPVFSAPADFGFKEALDKVQLRVHLSARDDETSERCHWHIPEAHFLESWSDARGHDGTVSIVQPLIAPLYGGKSAHDMLAAMSDRPERSAHDVVREHWSRAHGGSSPTDPAFESMWRRWLHDGVMPNTAFTQRSLSVRAEALPQPPAPASAPATERMLSVAFRLDPSVLDGRFANNGWLQELPKPITKLTWDNAIIMSPATAERLKVGGRPALQGGEHGQIVSDVVELRRGGRVIRGAVFTVPGHPHECATVHLGYGRWRAGTVGTGTGFNGYALRSSDALWSADNVEVGTDRREAVAGVHAVPPSDGRARRCPGSFARRVHEGPEIGPRGR
jgi:molybdopterin-containing oxidoreductase family iron-sulfur binding subunit